MNDWHFPENEQREVVYGEGNMPDLIPWAGGNCPVPAATIVETRFRCLDDRTYIGRADHPGNQWEPCQNPDGEIVGYRPVGSA